MQHSLGLLESSSYWGYARGIHRAMQTQPSAPHMGLLKVLIAHSFFWLLFLLVRFNSPRVEMQIWVNGARQDGRGDEEPSGKKGRKCTRRVYCCAVTFTKTTGITLSLKGELASRRRRPHPHALRPPLHRHTAASPSPCHYSSILVEAPQKKKNIP